MDFTCSRIKLSHHFSFSFLFFLSLLGDKNLGEFSDSEVQGHISSEEKLMDNPETSLNIVNSHQVTGSCPLRTCYGLSLCQSVLMMHLQVVTTVSTLNRGLSQPKELPTRLPS